MNVISHNFIFSSVLWIFLSLSTSTAQIQLNGMVGLCEPEPTVLRGSIFFGHLSLSASAMGTCVNVQSVFWSYGIDLMNDGMGPTNGFDIVTSPNSLNQYNIGDTIGLNTNPYADKEAHPFDASGLYPYGVHRIIWEVIDSCGNSTTSEHIFEIKDCQAPEIHCIPGSITFPIQPVGFVEIKVLDLIQSVEDNITIDEKLTFSYYRDRVDFDTAIWCDDFIRTGNTDMIIMDLNVWVNDEAGNSNHCIVRVIVVDHMDICGIDDPAGQIKGNVTSTSNEYTDAVLNLFDEKYGQIKQAVGPKFEFKDLNWSHKYRLVPTRDDDHVNGISTQDVILIRKYILGHVPLTPYQIMAADVNNTRNITMADITEIRKLILGVQEKFSKCKSFRFFTNELEISFPRIPWEATGEVLIEFDVFNWAYNIDFTAIKMGDVTGDARMSNLNDHVKPRTSQDLIISASPIVDLNDEFISYPVTSAQFILMQALQLGLAFDPQLEFVNIQSGLLNINDENVGTALLHKGIVRISWDELDAIECHPNDVLFTLHFKKKLSSDQISSLQLENSSMINEAYSLDGEVFSLKINNSELANESPQFIISPNPIINHLIIQSNSAINEQINLKLFDVQGKEILSKEFKLFSGSHTVQLDGLSYNGIMMARLTHTGKTDHFKLIRQER